MNFKKGSFEFDRFQILYRIYGNAPNVIICVSGAQQTIASWKPFVSYFAKKYTVVIYDPPGQGQSKVLHGSHSVSLDEQVTVLKRIINIAGPSQPINIAAASWGTIVSAVYVARAQDRVEKLILGSFGIKANTTLINMINEGYLLASHQRWAQLGDHMVEWIGSQLPNHYKNRIREQFRNMSYDQRMQFFFQTKFVKTVQNIHDIVDLSHINAETLIVNGANDKILNHDDLDTAKELIPNCECCILPGVGHFLHLENPEILKFYEKFLDNGLSAIAEVTR